MACVLCTLGGGSRFYEALGHSPSWKFLCKQESKLRQLFVSFSNNSLHRSFSAFDFVFLFWLLGMHSGMRDWRRGWDMCAAIGARRSHGAHCSCADSIGTGVIQKTYIVTKFNLNALGSTLQFFWLGRRMGGRIPSWIDKIFLWLLA